MHYFYKNVFSALFLFALWGGNVYAQPSAEFSDGGEYLKSMEYNFIVGGRYNVRNKSDLEKLFFGDVNATVEFFFEPPFEGARGFRIIQSSLGHYLLETKRISNWDEVEKELDSIFPTIAYPVEKYLALTQEESDASGAHNEKMNAKKDEERPKRYLISSQSLPVKEEFVEKLHHAVASAIDNFAPMGQQMMILDGYRSTFRCVVKDVLWTLAIHEPKGEIGRLTDMCNRIMKDAEANQLDERKYITLLNE
jgi:hypothetical protein